MMQSVDGRVSESVRKHFNYIPYNVLVMQFMSNLPYKLTQILLDILFLNWDQRRKMHLATTIRKNQRNPLINGLEDGRHLAPTLGPVSHPLLAPLTLGLSRLDNSKLLRSLRLLELCSWGDLTSRASDGSRTWLDLPMLLPDITLSPYPPVPQPWPGDPASTRPGLGALGSGLVTWSTSHLDRRLFPVKMGGFLSPVHDKTSPNAPAVRIWNICDRV